MTERTVSQDTWKLARTRFDGLETRQTMVERDLAELKVEVRDFRREMHERLDRMMAMFNERFDRQAAEMNARFAEVNARFDRQAAEVNTRFAEVNDRFDRQAAEVNTRFAEVNDRFDRLQQQMLSQTRWTVGTLALFGTLIAILVGIGQLRP